MSREVALAAAAQVARTLPPGITQDPDAAARHTISIAKIFENYLNGGTEEFVRCSYYWGNHDHQCVLPATHKQQGVECDYEGLGVNPPLSKGSLA